MKNFKEWSSHKILELFEKVAENLDLELTYEFDSVTIVIPRLYFETSAFSRSQLDTDLFSALGSPSDIKVPLIKYLKNSKFSLTVPPIIERWSGIIKEDQHNYCFHMGDKTLEAWSKCFYYDFISGRWESTHQGEYYEIADIEEAFKRDKILSSLEEFENFSLEKITTSAEKLNLFDFLKKIFSSTAPPSAIYYNSRRDAIEEWREAISKVMIENREPGWHRFQSRKFGL